MTEFAAGAEDMARRAELERRRAARAARVAQRHETALATANPDLRRFHVMMARSHRATERRHLAAAAMHSYYAERLRLASSEGRRPPGFMAAVANAAGVASAAVTIFSHDGLETACAASDTTAHAAQDLEFTFGEGPARAVRTRGESLVVTDQDLASLWPHYGPAVRKLGVYCVVAAPLTSYDEGLGSVTAYLSEDDVPAMAVLQVVSEALVATTFSPVNRDGLPVHPLFRDADFRPVLHQAVGMVTAARDCSSEDALALIRAHAFAEGMTADEVADAVVRREVTFS